ncbi:MAG: hypothetical protein HY072_06000 [Deltaproteobacteria bacterium]|nr:hypothetical protein [Deltaproteobacteria bacterium]
MIVLDEFQDVSFIPQALGLFRNSFQSFKNIPIILMGSKKQLLSDIFAKPSAPFAEFGIDIEFGDISYEEYWKYIQERFSQNELKISLQVAILWQDLLFRNSEAINRLGAYLVEHFQKTEITEKTN